MIHKLIHRYDKEPVAVMQGGRVRLKCGRCMYHRGVDNGDNIESRLPVDELDSKLTKILTARENSVAWYYEQPPLAKDFPRIDHWEAKAQLKTLLEQEYQRGLEDGTNGK